MEDSKEHLRKLYPDLNEEELEIAEDNLTQYLEVVLKIYERLEAEGKLDEMLAESRAGRVKETGNIGEVATGVELHQTLN